jgi:hypothetical protein
MHRLAKRNQSVHHAMMTPIHLPQADTHHTPTNHLCLHTDNHGRNSHIRKTPTRLSPFIGKKSNAATRTTFSNATESTAT